MQASRNGHTETVKALVAVRGIDVNHVNVSMYPLTPSPSHVVVGGEGGGGLPPLIPHPNPHNDEVPPNY